MNGKDFTKGFSCVIADLIRVYDQPTLAIGIMNANGVTVEDMRKSGVIKADLWLIESEYLKTVV